MTEASPGSAAESRRPEPVGPHRAYLRLLQVVYDLAYAAVLFLGSPFVLFMLVASRRWRAGLVERFGFCAPRGSDRPAIWIHGVSVGEVLAAKELVSLIGDALPEWEVVLSTTTRTGQQAAVRAYPGHQVFYYPIDFSFAIRRVLRRIRPSIVLLMELELWPNFLITTTMQDIPVLLANGRISVKSARDYRLFQKVIPEPMERVYHYCVQSEEYASRFRSLDVPDDRITITGSMKFDTVAADLPDSVRRGYQRRLGLTGDEFVLFAGSTHHGEEALVLEAFGRIREVDPRARLVVVPRHPERLGEAEDAIAAAGLRPVRLSTLRDPVPAAGALDDAVVVGDTMGELAHLYSIADLVFVGGSLTRRGGQNMMEPAGLGKAVVVGPNTWNFRDPVELLLSAGGLSQVPDAESVVEELVRLHADPERRERLGARARQVCLESKGATRRILEILRSHALRLSASSDGAET